MVSIPSLLSGLRIWGAVCSADCRGGSDLVWLWLWLWSRPVATAPIRPLVWECPYAIAVALKKKKKKMQKKKRKRKSLHISWPPWQEHPGQYQFKQKVFEEFPGA